jgi:hypothetical protein
MLILEFPAVLTSSHHIANLASLRASFDQWFENNFKNEHGLTVDNHEIYWLSKTGPNDGKVDLNFHPGIAVAVRQGGNEGYILTICAHIKEGRQSSYIPIYLAKLWSPIAATLLASKIMLAMLDTFQPE